MSSATMRRRQCALVLGPHSQGNRKLVSAERRDILRHARALFGIRQPPASCGEIVDHVLGLVGARYDDSHGGMREDEFEKELAPARTVEIGGPIRQLTAQGLAK